MIKQVRRLKTITAGDFWWGKPKDYNPESFDIAHGL